MILFACLNTRVNDETITFLRESDEYGFPTHFWTPELNQMLLNAIDDTNAYIVPFDTDSFSAIIDSGASSTATPFKVDCVPGIYEELNGV